MTSTHLEEARTLAQSVGVRMRDDLVELRLAGEEQRAWLNGQVTSEVRYTKKGDSVYGLAVTVRGRIMADVWILDNGDALSVLLPRTAEGTVRQSFDSQIIMEDVEIQACPNTRILSLLGPQAEALSAVVADEEGVRLFPGDELGLGGCFVLVDESRMAALRARLVTEATPMGGMAIGEAGYELARLRQRMPRFGLDFDERSYPQEAGLKVRAVSFNKGCYLGQEVICTLENRGKVARALRAITSTGPLAPNVDLQTEDGTVAGRLTSAAEDAEQECWLGLAYVKRSHADKPLSAAGIPVEVLGAI